MQNVTVAIRLNALKSFPTEVYDFDISFCNGCNYSVLDYRSHIMLVKMAVNCLNTATTSEAHVHK